MIINIISCKDNLDKEEIIKLLTNKYKNNDKCMYRQISETFLLPDKKWIIVNNSLVKQLTKRKTNINIYTSEVIKNALSEEY